MSVAEIEEKIIKPLSRAEKWQLIEDITRMLREEEEADRIFRPGTKAGFWSPCNEFKMADQLKTFLEEQP